MATDDGNDDFPKEIFLAIPLIGSAIAISYDIGYFYAVDIKFFTLFSIAEHIVFALEAAPIALLSAVVVVALFKTRADERLMQAGARHAASGSWWPSILLVTVLLFVILLLYMRWGGAGMVAGMAGAGVSIWLKASRPKRWIMILSVGCIVVVTSFAAGLDLAMQYLQFGQSRHSIHTDASESLAVKIIRSGDRGILYFEPKTKEVGFVKWDAIKRISEIW